MGMNKYDTPAQTSAPIPELPAGERLVPRRISSEEAVMAEEHGATVKSALEEFNQDLSDEHDGEPFFTLRGQDFMAGPLVRLWAEMLHRMAGSAEPQRSLRMAKAKRAYDLAAAMDAWPKKKIAD